MRTRPPAVAGSFYPAEPRVLAAMVDALLGPPAAGKPAAPDLAALVVPHAGYRCSGRVAASAYRVLRARRLAVRTVVVIGPAHFRDAGGLAVPACGAWASPLGAVAVDAGLRSRLVARGLVRVDDGCHAGEHSIEVQLPFLQRILRDGWSFLPVAARSVPAEVVADCIEEAADDSVAVLVSSDLSHYHDRTTAEALDRRTCEAILRRDVEAVRDDAACGAEAVRGLLTWASRHHLRLGLLDLATSAETCTGPDRVVGYGAFAVTGSSPPTGDR